MCIQHGDAFYDNVVRVATEPTGRLPVAVGKNLDKVARLQPDGWVGLAISHPASRRVLQELFDYTEEVPLLVAMFASTDPDSWDPASIARSTNRDDYGPDGWDGWFDAFIEVAEHRAGAVHAPLAVRAALSQLSIDRELRLGLIEAAVRRYLDYPEELRRALPITTRSEDDCSGGDGHIFAVDLAAALWQTEHRSEALAVLAAARAKQRPRSIRARDRFDVLSDIIKTAVPAQDLFDRYLMGDIGEDSCPSYKGWLDTVMDSPAISPLAAVRVGNAGYRDIASAITSGGLYRREPTQFGVLSKYAGFFPNAVRARRTHWATVIDAVWRRAFQTARSRMTAQVRARAESPPWKEVPLPSGMQPWAKTDSPSRPPANVRLPVDREAIIRYEAIGGEHAIVYQSSDYDQSGEVPAVGVWFARTEQGRWTRPVYLGIRQYSPYVVTPGSRLPLVKGDQIQLEVQVQQIDVSTIVFPPIATGLSRSATGLYLAIDLAIARRDRDGDGLSDIEEQTLGLDAANLDTDGDGIPDGVDPLPLTAYRPEAPVAESAVARALVNRIWGHDSQAIVEAPLVAGGPEPPDSAYTRSETIFLVGDPTMFAGLSATPRRLIVYTAEDLRILQRAPFYPPAIVHMFSSLDGLRHYVDWSAGWAGGRFIVTCSASGVSETKDISSWVS